MTDGDNLIKEAEAWSSIVPGLLVSDLARSVDVYTRLFGFELAHAEPDRLAVLTTGGDQLVLTQFHPEDPLVVAELTNPFGRGVTLHVRTADPAPINEALRAEKYPIVVPMEISELKSGDQTFTQTSFVVQDPDGYLLRFVEILGSRPRSPEAA